MVAQCFQADEYLGVQVFRRGPVGDFATVDPLLDARMCLPSYDAVSDRQTLLGSSRSCVGLLVQS